MNSDVSICIVRVRIAFEPAPLLGGSGKCATPRATRVIDRDDHFMKSRNNLLQ